MIKSRKIGFKEAIAIVRAKRKSVCPNLGFERQLKQYEREILEGNPSKLHLKKTVSEKIAEERKTSYYQFGAKNIHEAFKHEPRTADNGTRRRMDNLVKPPNTSSQSRPRDRRNFKVRPVNRELLFVYGQGQQKEREPLHLSEKIRPPVIQTHLKNGYPEKETLSKSKHY